MPDFPPHRQRIQLPKASALGNEGSSSTSGKVSRLRGVDGGRGATLDSDGALCGPDCRDRWQIEVVARRGERRRF